MNEELYEIYDENNHLIASYLTRQNALILIDALFVHYYNDFKLALTMKKMDLEVCSDEK